MVRVFRDLACAQKRVSGKPDSESGLVAVHCLSLVIARPPPTQPDTGRDAGVTTQTTTQNLRRNAALSPDIRAHKLTVPWSLDEAPRNVVRRRPSRRAVAPKVSRQLFCRILLGRFFSCYIFGACPGEEPPGVGITSEWRPLASNRLGAADCIRDGDISTPIR